MALIPTLDLNLPQMLGGVQIILWVMFKKISIQIYGHICMAIKQFQKIRMSISERDMPPLAPGAPRLMTIACSPSPLTCRCA